MANFSRRFSSFFAGCWAFIASLSFDCFSLSRALCTVRRAVEYAVKATALNLLPVKAEWRIIERMCSDNVREKINVFGRNPTSSSNAASSTLPSTGTGRKIHRRRNACIRFTTRFLEPEEPRG